MKKSANFCVLGCKNKKKIADCSSNKIDWQTDKLKPVDNKHSG